MGGERAAMSGLLNFLQGASNAAASNVSAPVDGLAWLLKKAGVNVGTPIGGSDWMRQQGLTADAPGIGGLLGESVGGVLPMIAAAKAPQIASGLLKVGENAAARPMLNPQTGAIVWHGSPHKFDKFDSSKIGTGEGAQAYGHGLYLAESPDVAKGYSLMADQNPTAQQYLRMWGGDRTKAEAAFMKDVQEGAFGKYTTQIASNGDVVASIRGKGQIYKVDLPDEKIARMLDWDKPLSQQHPDVQTALEKVLAKKAAEAEAKRLAMNAQYPGRTSHPVLGKIANKPRTAFDYKGEAAVSSLVQELGGPDKAAQYLRAQGIPGIRYLDGGSRGAGAGSSNFVVFPGEESALTILERNGGLLK